MHNEEMETSIYLRNYYRTLGVFDEELPEEIELGEEEFAKMKQGHEPKATTLQ